MRIAGDEVFLYQKLRKAVRREDISIHCAVSKLRDKRRDKAPGEIDNHRAGDGFCVVEVNLERQNHDAVPGLGDAGRAVHHDVHAAAQNVYQLDFAMDMGNRMKGIAVVSEKGEISIGNFISIDVHGAPHAGAETGANRS